MFFTSGLCVNPFILSIDTLQCLVISENNSHAWQLTDHFSKVFSKQK